MRQYHGKARTASGKWRETGGAMLAVAALATVTAWTGPSAPVSVSQHGVSGAIFSAIRGKCLSDYPNYSGQGLVAGIDACAHTSSQRWILPGDNTIRVQGRCLTIRKPASGTGVVVAACRRSAGQFREVDGIVRVPGVELLNPWSGRCLTVPRASAANKTQVQIRRCERSAAQTWYPPPSHPAAPPSARPA